MTSLTAPPMDLAPRLASTAIDDFAMPTGREEAWRFAPVDRLAGLLEPDGGSAAVVADPGPFISVVDFDPEDAGHWRPTDRGAVVAWAGARSAVQVRVPAETLVDEPIVVRLQAQGPRAHAHVDVRIGAHSRATVVVLNEGGSDVSGALVTEIGDGADLTMLSVIDGPRENVQMWHWPARVGRDARFTGSTITLGGSVVRNLPSVTYAGPGGAATLLGAFLADAGQYLEHRILVTHDQPHCTSSVVYKGALSGAGTHTVWVGDVVVRREAVATDTYEMNRNLLLDDGARADSVPNLELETGDVVSAGHASATGRFDDEQLFYLQARGIPEAVARQLVVRGFFVDVLSRVGSSQWRSIVLSRIADRLGMDPDFELDLEAAE